MSDYEELGFGKIELDRGECEGFGEVMFGEGKRKEEMSKMMCSLIFDNEVIVVRGVDEMKGK
ncbi:hypothetical protein [Staphylococcus epidermidis]|uniref:hypothetical protein n=1 Tax=Staphylococcus epidermidis TaxID=1282 RepID=UPI0011A9AFE3|nr:hypothetical protein [Staphylococcus epidermidis]